MTDCIILIVIAGALAVIARKKVSDIRTGKSGCGCGCSGCAGCSGCGGRDSSGKGSE
ncbi:MAG: FeoB-associated Cys-rich membrane protein [Lachnospiraceae bacterium]|nr:FeoB-associated Cys-rich membrane protein [Lachnospiraceae bacterium]